MFLALNFLFAWTRRGGHSTTSKGHKMYDLGEGGQRIEDRRTVYQSGVLLAVKVVKIGTLAKVSTSA